MLSFNSDMESGTTMIKEIQEKNYQKQRGANWVNIKIRDGLSFSCQISYKNPLKGLNIRLNYERG